MNTSEFDKLWYAARNCEHDMRVLEDLGEGQNPECAKCGAAKPETDGAS